MRGVGTAYPHPQVGAATLNLMTHGRCTARPGERIAIAPQPAQAHLFDAATGQRL